MLELRNLGSFGCGGFHPPAAREYALVLSNLIPNQFSWKALRKESNTLFCASYSANAWFLWTIRSHAHANMCYNKK